MCLTPYAPQTQSAFIASCIRPGPETFTNEHNESIIQLHSFHHGYALTVVLRQRISIFRQQAEAFNFLMGSDGAPRELLPVLRKRSDSFPESKETVPFSQAKGDLRNQSQIIKRCSGGNFKLGLRAEEKKQKNNNNSCGWEAITLRHAFFLDVSVSLIKAPQRQLSTR